MRQQPKSPGSWQLPWAAGSEQAPGRIAAMGGNIGFDCKGRVLSFLVCRHAPMRPVAVASSSSAPQHSPAGVCLVLHEPVSSARPCNTASGLRPAP